MSLKIRNETGTTFHVDTSLAIEIHCTDVPTTALTVLRPGDVLEVKGSRDLEVFLTDTALSIEAA